MIRHRVATTGVYRDGSAGEKMNGPENNRRDAGTRKRTQSDLFRLSFFFAPSR